MSDYDSLKEFWNKVLSGGEPEAISGKWAEDERFNGALKTYLVPDGTLLDYGCGSGWGLIEANYTVPQAAGLGIDPSQAGIEYAKACASLSDLPTLEFKQGDQNLLADYPEYFDAAISFNVLDVLPDEIIEDILAKVRAALKKGARWIVGINPDFPADFLTERGFSFEGRRMYKDGVLRGNEKTVDEWKALFGRFFTVIETREFALAELEKTYPRRMFVLQK